MRDFEIIRNAEHYSDPTAAEAITNVIKGEKKMGNFAKGDIYYFRTNSGKSNMFLIISDQNYQKNGYLIGVALVKEDLMPSPTHCEVFTKVQGAALCEQFIITQEDKIGDFVRTCTDEEMKRVDCCVKVALGMDDVPEEVEPDRDIREADERQFVSEAMHKAELAEKDKKSKN